MGRGKIQRRTRTPYSWTLKIVAGLADGPVRGYTSFAHFLLPQASTKLTLSDLRPAEIAELVEIVATG